MAQFYIPDGKRVLAVEDNEQIRLLYKRALGSTFDLQTADSLATAREILHGGIRFDAMILDLGMSGESTSDFWEWMLAEHATLADRTLVITGQSENAVFAPIVNGRRDWVMSKPVTPWEVRDQLRLLMETMPVTDSDVRGEGE